MRTLRYGLITLFTRATGTLLATAVVACLVMARPGIARADSVAEDLISILEQNGQLSPEQAAKLRDKAVLERERLKREVLDEVQVAADQVYSAQDEFEDMASGEQVVPSVGLADSMKLSGYIQFLSSFSDNNAGVNNANGNRASGVSSFETTDFRETDGFSIRRARLKVSGNIGPRTKYTLYFDGDAIDDPGSLDALNFNEAWIEHTPAFVDGTFAEGTWIRAGQFYVPFSREAQFSSSKRLPIARSQFVNELSPFRNVGVMVYNKGLVDGRLGLWGGVFNGTGENEDDNDPFLIAARAQYLVLDGTDTGLGPADWSVGTAIAASSDGNGLSDPAAAAGTGFRIVDPIYLDGRDADVRYRGDRVLWTADTQLDMGRFGFNAEVIYGDYDVRDRMVPTPGAGSVVQAGGDWDLVEDQDFWGFHVMPSFWVVEDTVQAYFKYEYVDYDNVLDASMWGTTLGVNYHLLPSHRSVIRANWVHLEHDTDVITAGRNDDLDQDFFLLEWQVKI